MEWWQRLESLRASRRSRSRGKEVGRGANEWRDVGQRCCCCYHLTCEDKVGGGEKSAMRYARLQVAVVVPILQPPV